MFCCLNEKNRKKRSCCCRCMAIGAALTVVSLLIIKIKTCICKKDVNDQLYDKEDIELKVNEEYENSELEDKVKEFNSRRLTIENESKNKDL
ncbi:MAG: hypothetical protein ACI4PU_04695 [Intestinibacter sp.]